MTANDRLREALHEMREQRDILNRNILAIEEVLGEKERVKRGRKPKVQEATKKAEDG